MMPQLIHAKFDIGVGGSKSPPLVGRMKNTHPISVNAMIQPALFLSVIGSIIALLWVVFDCRALMVQDGGCSPTTLWNRPRIKPRYLPQGKPSTKIRDSIQQGFLGAGDLGKANRSPFVTAEVVVDSVDLQKS